MTTLPVGDWDVCASCANPVRTNAAWFCDCQEHDLLATCGATCQLDLHEPDPMDLAEDHIFRNTL